VQCDVTRTACNATRVVGPADEENDGIVPYVVQFSDEAGNPGAPVSATTDGTQVVLDVTPPTVSDVLLSSAQAPLPSRVGDELVLTFVPSEPLQQPISATVAGQMVPVICFSDNSKCQATLIVPDSPREGLVQVEITYADTAGNSGAPYSGTPTLSGTDDPATISTAAASIKHIGIHGQAYTSEFATGAVSRRRLNVAGSASEPAFTPGFPHYVKNGGKVRVVVTTSMPAEGWDISLLGRPAPVTPVFGTNDLIATGVVAADDPEGPAAFSVIVKDRDGNMLQTQAGVGGTDGSAVVLDHTPPKLFPVGLALHATGLQLPPGSPPPPLGFVATPVVQLTFTPSEPITFRQTPSATVGGVTVPGGISIYFMDEPVPVNMLSLAPDGGYTVMWTPPLARFAGQTIRFLIEFVDRAGNAGVPVSSTSDGSIVALPKDEDSDGCVASIDVDDTDPTRCLPTNQGSELPEEPAELPPAQTCQEDEFPWWLVGLIVLLVLCVCLLLVLLCMRCHRKRALLVRARLLPAAGGKQAQLQLTIIRGRKLLSGSDHEDLYVRAEFNGEECETSTLLDASGHPSWGKDGETLQFALAATDMHAGHFPTLWEKLRINVYIAEVSDASETKQLRLPDTPLWSCYNIPELVVAGSSQYEWMFTKWLPLREPDYDGVVVQDVSLPLLAPSPDVGPQTPAATPDYGASSREPEHWNVTSKPSLGAALLAGDGSGPDGKGAGNGTEASPYVLCPLVVGAGRSARSLETVTITDCAPNAEVLVTDLKAGQNMRRFGPPCLEVDAAGVLRFQMEFDDAAPGQPSSDGTTHEALLRVGQNCVYFSWRVTIMVDCEEPRKASTLRDFEALVAEARANAAVRRWGDAVAEYQSALALFPKHAVVAREEVDAERERTEALRVLWERGEAAMAAQDYDGAGAAVAEALLLDPHNRRFELQADEARRRAQAREQLARLRAEGEQALAAGDVVRAANLLDEALVLAPQDGALRDAAEQAHEENTRLSRKDELRRHGEVELAGRHYAAAALTLQTAAALDEGDQELCALAARAKAKADAEARFNELVCMARMERTFRNYEGAVGVYDQALAINVDGEFEAVSSGGAQTPGTPSNSGHNVVMAERNECDRLRRVAAYKDSAHRHMLSGDYAAAVRELGMALDLAPDDARLAQDKAAAEKQRQAQDLRQKGEDLLSERRWAEAARTLLECLRLDPANLTVQEEQKLADCRARGAQLTEEGQTALRARRYELAVERFTVAKSIIADDGGGADLVALIDRAKKLHHARLERLTKAAHLAEQGEHLLQMADPRGAVTAYETALNMLSLPDDEARDEVVNVELHFVFAADIRGRLAQAQEKAEGARRAEAAAEASEEARRAEATRLEDEKRARAAELKQEGRRLLAAHSYEKAAEQFSVARSLDTSDAELPQLLGQAQELQRERAARLTKAKHLVEQGDHELAAGDAHAATLAFATALGLLELPKDEERGGLNVEPQWVFGAEIRQRQRRAEHCGAEAAAEAAAAQEERRFRGASLKSHGLEALRHGSYNDALRALDEAAGLGNAAQSDDLAPLRAAAQHGARAEARVKELTTQAMSIMGRPPNPDGVAVSQDEMDDAVRLAQAAVEAAQWEEAVTILEDALEAARLKAHAGEMGRRLQKVGAKVGKLTCSLMWDNANDLDIHCETPAGEHIWYGSKRAKQCGGFLDVDMNAKEGDTTAMPIENLFWANPLPGRYKFWVEAVDMDRAREATPYTVRLTHGAEVQEQRWEGIEEDDEVPAFEITLKAERPRLRTADMDGPNTVHLHVAHELMMSARSTLQRAMQRRQQLAELTALRKLGATQAAAHEWTQARATYERALALAPDHPGTRAALESCAAGLRADALVGEASAARAQSAIVGAHAEAHGKVALALELCPNHTGALDMAAELASEHHRLKEELVVDRTDADAVAAIAKAQATQIMRELDLSGHDQRLNYRMFISWWQRKLKQSRESGSPHSSRISDEDLQTTMVIWHESDEDGYGVNAAGLGNVVGKMLKAGIIRMTPDGHVLPAETDVAHMRENELAQRHGRAKDEIHAMLSQRP
jgi:hypothetical protein